MGNDASTIADTMLEIFRAYGVEHVFSSPGSEWAPLWDALARAKSLSTGPGYVNARHEEAAVALASGYYHQSRKLPVVLLHTGVGTLNGAMALRAASQSHVPMVVLAGDTAGFGEFPDCDPGIHWASSLANIGGSAALARPFVKRSTTVRSREALLGMLQDACRLALTPPKGTVFLSVPLEYLLVEGSPSYHGRCAPPPPPVHADPAALEDVARQLVGAKRPVLITEYAGRDPRNVAPLVELAEKLALPVVEACSPGFMNFPRDHEFHQGFDAQPLLRDADLALLVAAQTPWFPQKQRPANARIILLDEDPAHEELPYWGIGVDTVISGDLPSSLTRLNALVADLQAGGATSPGALDERRALFAARHNQSREEARAKALALADKRPMAPMWVTEVIGEELPQDALVLDETITHKRLVTQRIIRNQPGTLFNKLGGGLGSGIGVALGIKFAKPDRLVAAFIGDGAFHYNPVLADLGFAQQYRMPILLFLMDNQGYAAMKRALTDSYPDGWSVRTDTYFGYEIEPTPDYVAIAQAYGGYGERVEDPKELRAAVRRGIEQVESGRLALLDLVLQPRIG